MTTIFDAALNYLSYRARTEKEIRDYLIKKDFRRDKIPETIQKLKEYNYINDKEFTLTAISSNAFGKRLSKTNLKRALEKKGIKSEDLELVDEMVSYEDEEAFCEFHFKKAMTRTEGSPYKKRYPKIVNYLQRRGFTKDHYSHLLSQIPKTGEIDQDEFQKHLDHYIKLYTRKGFEGFEFKNRVIKGMLGRGYDYYKVKEALDEVLLS